MLKILYEMMQVTLDKDSINDLEIINPRNTHASQVKSIYQALCKGEHFDTNFVINKIDSKTRIIDGNHRISALRLYFKRYPTEQVQVYFAVYNNLSEEQERMIFTRWNMGVNQSVDDFIHSYKETIPVFNRLITELPCTVYGSKCKMKLKHITDAYFASFEYPYKGGQSKPKFKVIQELQQLKNKDVDTILKNFDIIHQIFNENDTKDISNISAFRNIIYRGIYYIVANTVDSYGEEHIVKIMKKNLLNRTIIEQFRRFHGRNAAVDAYQTFKQTLDVEIKIPAGKEKKKEIKKKKELPITTDTHEKEKPKNQTEIMKNLRDIVIERKKEMQ